MTEERIERAHKIEFVKKIIPEQLSDWKVEETTLVKFLKNRGGYQLLAGHGNIHIMPVLPSGQNIYRCCLFL